MELEDLKAELLLLQKECGELEATSKTNDPKDEEIKRTVAEFSELQNLLALAKSENETLVQILVQLESSLELSSSSARITTDQETNSATGGPPPPPGAPPPPPIPKTKPPTKPSEGGMNALLAQGKGLKKAEPTPKAAPAGDLMDEMAAKLRARKTNPVTNVGQKPPTPSSPAPVQFQLKKSQRPNTPNPQPQEERPSSPGFPIKLKQVRAPSAQDSPTQAICNAAPLVSHLAQKDQLAQPVLPKLKMPQGPPPSPQQPAPPRVNNPAPSKPTPPKNPPPSKKLILPGPGNYVDYEDLKAKKAIDQWDKTILEIYLNDEQFQKVFGMNKEEFGKLPPWQQSKKKQAAGLF